MSTTVTPLEPQELDRRFTEIVDELTRRGLLVTGVGTAAALGLAGCGDDRTSVTGGDVSRPGFPVSVAGKEGTARLSAPPRRVVAVGYLRDTDLALALGANLVGVVKSAAFPSGLAPWQRPSDHPALLDGADGLPYEKIAALAPDLILASDDYTLAQDYDNLSRIAPTLSYRTGVGRDSWAEMTTRAGRVLGEESKAYQLVKAVQKKIAKARSDHPALAGKTFTGGLVASPSQIYTTNSTSQASVGLYGDLGMRLSPKVSSLPASGGSGKASVSPERWDLLDADAMILAYTDRHVRKAVEANPVFQRIGAVQRGGYIALDVGTAAAIGFPSVLSIPYGLDALVPKLAAAVTAR